MVVDAEPLVDVELSAPVADVEPVVVVAPVEEVVPVPVVVVEPADPVAVVEPVPVTVVEGCVVPCEPVVELCKSGLFLVVSILVLSVLRADVSFFVLSDCWLNAPKESNRAVAARKNLFDLII